MSASNLHTTGDSWKELAEKYSIKTPLAAQVLINRMNEVWPFSKATGVFDTGCGPGVIISCIAGVYGLQIPVSAKVLAGDFSDPMLEALRKTKQSRIESPGDVWDRLEVRNIDAQDLSSIPDDSMSHVTGGMVYFLLPDPRKALRETNRVLCPGGVLATSNGKTAQHIDALGKAMEKVRPGTNLNLLSGPWTSEEGVKREFTATGFVDVETHLVDGTMDYTTHEQFADVLLKMPVMKNAMTDLSKDEISLLRQATIDCLREKNPSEPGTLTGVSIVALGRKPSVALSA